ncbi:cytochrome P450 [Tessaracoccus antarcticus]|uniref:Cytochrome P450 n=1 Tax=Tessaracoccus antarcticus TaxID=2479848 RepID=A0A3M0G157_9ACTN|nr:cytochrome P450 [Tessaracoccus antarcticus]RMB58348.1 cytochrome P450 [Tessaracoccus antarcticus]
MGETWEEVGIITDLRWSRKPGEAAEPRVEKDGDLWRIRSMEVARQVLRARHATTQAGFTAEAIPQGFLKNHPILFSDGPLHDEQRSKVARFFAPKIVATRYQDLMDSAAEAVIADAQSSDSFDLDELSLYFTVEVTAEVVGLTNSKVRPMSHRLVRFFNQPAFDITRKDLGRTNRQWMQAALNGLWPVVRFWFSDVRPAIRARRKEPQEDVISHLIAEGYGNMDILVEATTYGTAGMVTTREYICMAAWHLLKHDALRARYLVAGEKERHAILHEIIRLEPVVGHIYRRAQDDIEISDGDQTWTIRAGELIDLYIRHTNADPLTVGDEPLNLCPGRELPRGVNETVLSFGDGAHKCPGQHLAISESDALLRRLLARDVVILQEPVMGWDELISGYMLRGFALRIGPGTWRHDGAPSEA